MKISPISDEPPLRQQIILVHNFFQGNILGIEKKFIQRTSKLQPFFDKAYLHGSLFLVLIFSIWLNNTITAPKPTINNASRNHFNSLIATYLPLTNQNSSLVSRAIAIKKSVKRKTSYYIVADGDTISKIAQKYNLTEATIQYSNKISNVNLLAAGQKLKIPSKNLTNSQILAARRSMPSVTDTYAYRRTTVPRSDYRSYARGFIVPIVHRGISQYMHSYHHGIDYMANIGTPVRAAGSGYVEIAAYGGWNHGYGTTILINHGSKRTTRYGHLSRIYVSVGQWVNQGEVIGLSGNTGKSTGPHLHFEYRVNNIPRYPF